MKNVKSVVIPKDKMAASHCTLSKSSGKPTSKSKSGTRTAARDSNKTIWSTRSRQGAARTVSLESRSKTNALPQSSDTDIVPSTLQAVTENVADVDLVSERSDFSAMNTGNTEREDTMNPPVDPSGFKPGPSNHESRSRSRSRSPRRASRDRSDGRGKKRRKHHHTHDISSSDDEASTIRQLKTRLAALEEYQNPPFYGQCPPFMPNYQPSFFPDPSEDDDPLKLLETDSTLEEGECEDLDSVLSIITEGTDSNQKGKALSTSAHNLVKNFFDKEPDVKVIKELRDRYAEPENCENLAAKTLNPEIERFLKKPAQRRDNCLKGIQASVAAGAVANLRQIDDISAMHKSGQFDPELCRKLLRTVCDSTKILARCYSDISTFRKVNLRSMVDPKYQALCTKRTHGPTLFGTDFTKEIKAIDEESKIMRSMGRGHQFRSHQPQPYGFPPKNWQFRGRGQSRPPYYQSYQFRGRSRPRGPHGHVNRSRNPQPSQQ